MADIKTNFKISMFYFLCLVTILNCFTEKKEDAVDLDLDLDDISGSTGNGSGASRKGKGKGAASKQQASLNMPLLSSALSNAMSNPSENASNPNEGLINLGPGFSPFGTGPNSPKKDEISYDWVRLLKYEIKIIIDSI